MKPVTQSIKKIGFVLIMVILGLSIQQQGFAQTFYVNDNNTGGDVFTTAVGNDANPGTSSAPFRTIQFAVNSASPGSTILVDAGTYDEQVLVNKGLVIQGSASNQPVIDFTGTIIGKPTLFDISANGVTVENVRFDVDLAKLKSAIIASASSLDLITVKNNLITGYGSPSAGTYSDRNAVSINYTGNTNYRVATGGVNSIIFQGNIVNGTAPTGYFRAALAADEAGGSFTGNILQTINHDIIVRFGNNGNINITGNSFHGGGVEVVDMNPGAGVLTISNNFFIATFANTSAPFTAVLRLQNNYHSKTTQVNNNTFSDHQWAVSLANYNSVTLNNNNFTPVASSTTYHHIVVNSKSISTNSNSILQVTLGGTFTNNIFNGSGTSGGTALSFHHHDNDATSFGTFVIGSPGSENRFNAGILRHIYLDNQTGSSSGATFPAYNSVIGSAPGALTSMGVWPANLNAVNNRYDLGSGLEFTSAMSITNLFALEDRVQHAVDLTGLGFVLVKPNNTYVTLNSFASPSTTPSVQRGIDAASNGFIVNLSPGTFIGNTVVNKEVEIKGQGIGITNVIPATTAANTGGGSLGGTNVFLVQSNNVTINNLTVDGDNPTLPGGVNVGGANIDARNGIITNHAAGVYNNLIVHHVNIINIYLRGLYASSGGTFDFHHNTLSNVQAESGSIAIFNFGGSGIIDNNTVTNANDAIASNNSKGTVMSNNTVSNSGTGLHSDNNGSGGIGVADDIFNNTVSNSKLNGYGIFVFAPYRNVTVHENTISNVDVGMASTGHYSAVTPVFSNNVIDGQNKANSTGMYATTLIWGFADGNNNTSFINNYVVNNVDGFYLETTSGFTLNFNASFNSITGNTSSSVTVAGAGTANAEMSCNWWGTTVSATIDAQIIGTVSFIPYLTSGSDSQPASIGFQTTESCSTCSIVLSTSSTPSSCLPNNNGTASVSITSGAVSPVSYSWNTIPLQTGTTATGLTPGTYTVTVTAGNGCTAQANVVVTQTSVVSATLAPVTGIINVCPYVGTGTQLTYWVPSIPGATSYSWVVPSTVTIVSGQGDTSITVTINNGFIQGGNKQLRVRAIAACGSTAIRIHYLVAQLPGTPSPIIASSSNVCPILGTAGTITYTIPKVSAATSYIWTTQPGTTTVNHPNGPGVNDTTVTVGFSNGFSTSAITVQAVNGCGTTAARSLMITRNNPARPSPITGPTNACAYIAPNGTPAAYSVPVVANVTSYTWTVPVGATGLTGQGTNSISFIYPSGFTSGSVSVTSSNGCGTSTVRSLPVSRLLPATPSVIDIIQQAPCPNRVYTYTLSVMPANATSVNWTTPTGSTLVSGQGTTSITVSYPGTAIEGFVTAQAINNCGSSVIRSATIKLPACAEPRMFAKTTNNDQLTSPDAFELNVFPNPSVTDFKLRVNTSGTEKLPVRILDLQGREISRTSITPNQTITIGNNLRAGAYVIEVLKAKEIKTARVIKF